MLVHLLKDRPFILVLGALLGAGVGTALGWFVVPTLTQEWLFTTSWQRIRSISGPTLAVFGFWAGMVLSDLLLATKMRTDADRSAKLALHGWWSVALGAFALLDALCLTPPALELMEPGWRRVLAAVLGDGDQFTSVFWLLLVNALAAGVVSILLGVSGLRVDDRRRRGMAMLGLGLGVVSLVIASIWLFVGGVFALFWAP